MAPYPKADDIQAWLVLTGPLIALGLNVAAQIVLLRSTSGTRYMRSMIGGFLAGAAGLAVLELILFTRWACSLEDLAVQILTYGTLSYCYFHFVNLGQSSIRIRIYAEIAASPGGLSIHDLARDYNEEALMDLRLRRLAESGDIIERNGRYFVGRRRLIHIARAIFAAKLLVLGRKSEFFQS